MGLFDWTDARPKHLITWAKNYKIDLPQKVDDLENVTQLDLAFKGLVKLPKEIDCLKNLVEINALGNELTELPWEFGHFKKLKTINLSHNKLIDIPGVICRLSGIEHINIESNLIKKVSPIIANLTNLETLNLAYNNITDLPQEISHLKHLVSLNISANLLTSLPSAFTKLYNLNELHIWKNNFSELPALLSEMPNLKKIVTDADNIAINQHLIMASLTSNTEKALKLLQLGADVNYKWPNFHSHAFSTALFAAKTADMARLLLDNGADATLKREIAKQGGYKEGEEPEYETFLTKKHGSEMAKYVKTLNF